VDEPRERSAERQIISIYKRHAAAADYENSPQDDDDDDDDDANC
jgi:hypothetical protein